MDGRRISPVVVLGDPPGCSHGSEGAEIRRAVRRPVEKGDRDSVPTGRRGYPLPYEKRLGEGFLAHHQGRPFKFSECSTHWDGKSPNSGQDWSLPGKPPLSAWIPSSGKGVKQIHTRKAIVLTAFVVKPRLKSPVCLGVVSAVRYTVHIPSGLEGRPIYDGSQSLAVKSGQGPRHG